MKPSCDEKCRLKCYGKLTEEERNGIFTAYWNLSDITKQREFIQHSISEVKPSYRYIRVVGSRQQRRLNSAFHFVKDNQKIRVCMLFY